MRVQDLGLLPLFSINNKNKFTYGFVRIKLWTLSRLQKKYKKLLPFKVKKINNNNVLQLRL
jgi:hypothetical protein